MSEYYTLGTWNSSGVPNYLTSIDTVEQSLLNSIFQVLPEGSSVLTNHPEYFTSNIQKNLII